MYTGNYHNSVYHLSMSNVSANLLFQQKTKLMASLRILLLLEEEDSQFTLTSIFVLFGTFYLITALLEDHSYLFLSCNLFF